MKILSFFKILFLLCFITSCSSIPDNVQLVLEEAGDNKTELVKAIDHFKALGDDKKLEAVYYLIGGMKDKYSYTGEVHNSLHERIMGFKLELDSLSLIPEFTPRRVENIRRRKAGRIVPDLMKNNSLERIKDCKIITATYIIKNVEQAFEAWSMPWAKEVNFNQFCEYILPYKIGNEKIMNWRDKVLEDFAWVKNDMAKASLKDVCIKLNDTIRYNMRQDISFNYPMDFDYDAMKFLRRGSCNHTTRFAIFVMRGLGVPVSKETSSFLNESSHAWGALHTQDSIIPFEASTNKHGFDLIYIGSARSKRNNDNYDTAPYRKIVKVERFAYNTKSIKKANNINISKDKYDVTEDYVDVSNIELDVEGEYVKNKTYALSSFNRQSWRPNFFSNSRTGKVTFENLPQGVIYLPQQVIDGTSVSPNGNPFLIDEQGVVNEIKLDKENTQNITLTRKYPMYKRVKHWSDILVGSRFQVANHIDFRDSITLSTIKKSPIHYFQNIDVTLNSKYQYFRILFPKSKLKISIAEIEVYKDSNNEVLDHRRVIAKNYFDRASKVFDKDLLSYAGSKDNDTISWIGLDFKKPINISKIKYLQRTDLNMIVPGNKYELVYWDDKWVSLGTQIATGNELVYKDVPKNALFLLHNLTEGKEERIFLYENGEQVFY